MDSDQKANQATRMAAWKEYNEAYEEKEKVRKEIFENLIHLPASVERNAKGKVKYEDEEKKKFKRIGLRYEELYPFEKKKFDQARKRLKRASQALMQAEGVLSEKDKPGEPTAKCKYRSENKLPGHSERTDEVAGIVKQILDDNDVSKKKKTIGTAELDDGTMLITFSGGDKKTANLMKRIKGPLDEKMKEKNINYELVASADGDLTKDFDNALVLNKKGRHQLKKGPDNCCVEPKLFQGARKRKSKIKNFSAMDYGSGPNMTPRKDNPEFKSPCGSCKKNSQKMLEATG